MPGNRLIDTIMKTVQKCLDRETLTEFEYGTVTTANPLQILVGDKPVITADFLVLSEFCKRKTVVIKGETVELWPDLHAGDRVRMLRCQKGQLYYVLDRQR